MYNSFIIIICVFAVYGAYAIFREVSSLFLRKSKVVIAIEAEDDNAVQDALLLAESYIQSDKCFCPKPIILCNSENEEDYIKYGLDIYVKSGKESYAAGESDKRQC